MKCLSSRLQLTVLFCLSLLLHGAVATSSMADNSAAPTPALWKISDEDSTIYLFGTVHILRPDLNWRSAIVNSAFASSDTVVFEAPADTSNPQKMQALIAQYGLNPPGTTLSSLMSEQGKRDLADVLAQFNMAGSAANFEPLRPWLVSITLAALQIQATGGDPNAGVERILGAEAVADGKAITYLETDEQQMRMLGGMSPEAELFLLEDGLRQLKENPDQVTDLVTFWRSGDVDALGDLMVATLAPQEEVYETILAARNRDWVRQLKKMLEGSGTIFVAVGTAHLAGDRSVQDYLRAEGIAVTRQ